ncbi:hypothetical protein [Anaerosinus massiliensis]|uniref:hypothetical protein n=1 Tax=Massilibacillus massiliensis TaxID=1806837 RepID=UPI000DA63376|nr:hypothetical protein [Massilibacillus massiliensis]
MLLSTKHANQTTITVSNFTGGLNSTTIPEMIGDNQLSEAVNMEVDTSTGTLRTCSGTKLSYAPDIPIYAAMWDKINEEMLFVSENRAVYLVNFTRRIHEKIGQLNGFLYPLYTEWEDGILIAAGAKLQYYNGKKLITLNDSPAVCDAVYIRAGRVFINHDNEIRYSAVGDETDWKEDDNVDSASKFVEAGYKDGGKVIGLVNLSSDIIIIKDNNRIYRLSGEYPAWSIREISREVDCSGRLSFCGIANGVFIVGENKLQLISTTQEYGDMKAANVANNVINLFAHLPKNPRCKYVPTLNQVWILSKIGSVIVYDLTYSCFFERRFTSNVIDVISVNDTVYVIKENGIYVLDSNVFSDEAEPLEWRFMAKRIVSYYEYLLKRVQVSYISLLEEDNPAEVTVGAVTLKLKPMPASPLIYENNDLIYNNDSLLYPIVSQFGNTRCVYRNRYLDIKGKGSGSGIIFNKIMFDIVEV